MSDMGTGASIGMRRMVADIGSMMPRMAPRNDHQMQMAHHGMYANRMTFMGDAKSIMGWGTPRNTTTYEHQQMASEDMGQRVAGATIFGAAHGGNAVLSWVGSSAALMQGGKAGWSAGKAYGAARAVTAGYAAGGAVAGGAGIAAGVGGAVLGAALPLAAVYGTTKAVEAVVNDVKDRQQVSNFIQASSWRYAPASGEDIDKRHGGFNRDARSKIASAMKKYDYTDRNYDFGDLKGILESGTEMGMFSGAKDAEDFGKKFKNLAETLKKVTKTLHTSLADGMKVIKSMKDSGIDASNIGSAINTADILGSASGRTASEMLSYGTQGAEMVRGTGIATAAGYSMMQSGIASTTLGARSGAISASAVEQAGGVERLAQQSMGASINYMQSNMGRGFLMAMGGADGNLDRGKMMKLMSTGTTLHDVADMATDNASTVGGYLKSVVGQEGRMRKLSESMGGRGVELMAMSGLMVNAEQTALATGVDKETALRYNMKMSGYNQSVIDNQIGGMKNIESERSSMVQANNLASRKALGNIASSRLDWSGRFKDKMYAGTIGRVGEAVNEGYDYIAEGVSNKVTSLQDSITDYVTGAKRVELKTMTRDQRIKAAYSSDGPSFKGDESLSSSNYSKAEVEAFTKSKDFSEMSSKIGMRTLYGEEASRASGIEQYSSAVLGKSYGDLDKKEKMYLDYQAKRTGRSGLSRSIEERRTDDLESLSLSKGEFLEQNKEETEELQKSFKGDLDSYLSKKGASKVLKTKDGKRTLFSDNPDYFMKKMVKNDSKGYLALLETKKDISDLDEERADAIKSGEAYDDDEYEKKKKLLEDKQSGLMGDFVSKSHDKMMKKKDRAAGQDAIMKSLEGPLTVEQSKLLSYKGKLEGAGASEGKVQLELLRKESNNAMQAAGITKLNKVDGANAGEFAELMEDFKKGDIGGGAFGDGGMERLLELSGKAGLDQLSGTLNQGIAFKKAAGVDGTMTTDEFKEFSKKMNVDLTNMGDLSKVFGKDVDASEYMKQTQLIDQNQSGTKVFGSVGSSASRDQESKIMNDLSTAQNKTAVNMMLLEKLYTRLNAKVSK